MFLVADQHEVWLSRANDFKQVNPTFLRKHRAGLYQIIWFATAPNLLIGLTAAMCNPLCWFNLRFVLPLRHFASVIAFMSTQDL